MEKQGSRKAERQHLKEATVRRSREEEEKKKQRLSSQNRAEADERKQNGRGKPESESIREAPVEQLWERNREG